MKLPAQTEAEAAEYFHRTHTWVSRTAMMLQGHSTSPTPACTQQQSKVEPWNASGNLNNRDGFSWAVITPTYLRYCAQALAFSRSPWARGSCIGAAVEPPNSSVVRVAGANQQRWLILKVPLALATFVGGPGLRTEQASDPAAIQQTRQCGKAECTMHV